MKYFQKYIHFVFPHENNNYKAKLLHNKSIVFYIFLTLIIQLLTGFVRNIQPQVLGYAADISTEKILLLINQKRAGIGLIPLNLSENLSVAAANKAADMFDKNYWAHVSPTGTTPWKFFQDVNYDYLYAGENLAKDFDRSEEVVEAWMNSPSHRANILKPEYSDIGLAVVNGKLNGSETSLVVQEFGTPKNNAALNPSKNVTQNESVNTEKIISQNIPEPSQTGKRTNLLSYFQISKSFSLLLAELLMVVLFIDGIYIWKTRTVRISGKSLAHLIFILALIGAMGFTGAGVIL